jgi:hypothetical protein
MAQDQWARDVFATVLKESFFTDEVLYQQVKVDGELYVCKGIEAFAVNRLNTDKGYEYHKGERVGLLVRKV